MRSVACVLLWGCVPVVELDLPSPDLETHSGWLLASGDNAQVFETNEDIRFVIEPDAQLFAVALSRPLDELGLEVGPIEVVSSEGRLIHLQESGAQSFISATGDESPRNWKGPSESEVWPRIPDLNRDRCYRSGGCRADAEFTYCAPCEAPMLLPIDAPVTSLRGERPSAPICAANERWFRTGCRAVGSVCPPPNEWPNVPNAIRVDTGESLQAAISAAASGAVILFRGAHAADIDRPLELRGVCPEASFADLRIFSSSVSLANLEIGHLTVVQEAELEDAVVEDLHVALGGSIEVHSSAIERFVVFGNAALMDVSFELGVCTGNLTMEDAASLEGSFNSDGCDVVLRRVSMVDGDLTVGGGNVRFEEVALSADSLTLAHDGALVVVDSLLGPTWLSRETTVMSGVEIAEPAAASSLPAPTALLINLGTTDLSDITIDSVTSGLRIVDAEVTIADARISAHDVGIFVGGQGMRTTVTRAEVTGSTAAQIEAGTTFSHVRSHGTIAVSPMGQFSGDMLAIDGDVGLDIRAGSAGIEHCEIRAVSRGIWIDRPAKAAISDFTIDSDNVGIDAGSPDCSSTTLRLGTISASRPLVGEGDLDSCFEHTHLIWKER